MLKYQNQAYFFTSSLRDLAIIRETIARINLKSKRKIFLGGSIWGSIKATANHPAERLTKRSERISSQTGDKIIIQISLKENPFVYKFLKDAVDEILKKE